MMVFIHLKACRKISVRVLRANDSHLNHKSIMFLSRLRHGQYFTSPASIRCCLHLTGLLACYPDLRSLSFPAVVGVLMSYVMHPKFFSVGAACNMSCSAFTFFTTPSRFILRDGV